MRELRCFAPCVLGVCSRVPQYCAITSVQYGQFAVVTVMEDVLTLLGRGMCTAETFMLHTEAGWVVDLV